MSEVELLNQEGSVQTRQLVQRNVVLSFERLNLVDLAHLALVVILVEDDEVVLLAQKVRHKKTPTGDGRGRVPSNVDANQPQKAVAATMISIVNATMRAVSAHRGPSLLNDLTFGLSSISW